MTEEEIRRQARALAWAQCYATILAALITRAHKPINYDQLRYHAQLEANTAYSIVEVSV